MLLVRPKESCSAPMGDQWLGGDDALSDVDGGARSFR